MSEAIEGNGMTSRPMLQAEWEQSWIGALSADIELGWCSAVRGSMMTIGNLIRQQGSVTTKAAYARLIARAAELFEIEALHGKGSALNLEHPDLRHYTRSNSRSTAAAITPEEVANAQAFRARFRNSPSQLEPQSSPKEISER